MGRSFCERRNESGREGLGEVREVYLDGFFQPSVGESALLSSLEQRAERFVATVPADVEAMYAKLPVKQLKTGASATAHARGRQGAQPGA